MKVAIVGASGAVGQEFMRVLDEQNFPVTELVLFGSERSAGRIFTFRGKDHVVKLLQHNDDFKDIDIAFVAMGAGPAREFAPTITKHGCIMIDNSSAFRMDDDVPLVVPEVNGEDALNTPRNIIANPNCSTIQMVLALSGLQKRYGIRRIVVSTYQSVTGTGMKAIRQLEAEERGETPEAMAYPCPVHRNLFPHGGDFCDDLYTTEEHKLVDETRKIFDDKTIQVSATVARVPVVGGHSESVNVELKEEFELDEVRKIIAETEGCVLYDNPEKLEYPTPLLSHHRDEVFVGRLRRDPSQPRTLNMWVVADNLRKGAATNAIEIMQKLLAIS